MPVSQLDLTGALARGELSAWFQPQYDMQTHEIVGLEALCRWRHPRHGFIAPTTFIPLAEETGLIGDLGRFMATETIAAIRRWWSRARPLDVSVNVSPLQLVTPAFTVWLAGQLSQLGERAKSLTIEITETHPVDDVAAVVPRLDHLRSLGLRISIDDFGTGQASLKQLRRLHGSELKIDRSLVADVSRASTDFLERTIDAAHESGICVVAEGIETEEHFERMKRLGCDRAQGYLLAHPAPREEIEKLLAG